MARRRNPTGRNDILEAALSAFADRGYAGATTAAIARAAGVTQPLVHHHFGSKEGLWQAVIEQVFGELEEALVAARTASAALGPEDRLRQLLRTFIVFSRQRPQIGRLIRIESAAPGPAYDAVYDNGLSGMSGLFRDELERAVQAGVLRAVDPAVAYCLVVGACTQPFTEPETVRRTFGVHVADEAFLQAYADTVIDVVLAGLAPR